MKHLAFAIAVALMPVSVPAQDFDAGLVAANAGDFATAIQEWLPLAENGNSFAQTNLAVIHYWGYGVPQNYAEAARWYRLAAEQGNAEAQANLGYMYTEGLGVTQDFAEGRRLSRLAAEQGSTQAQANLGAMYQNGDGVALDFVTAHMWFIIAAASGDVIAGDQRDEVAGWMTSADVSEAQRRARVCIASGYQDCD